MSPTPVEVVSNPVIISWSEIDTFRQCPYKHHLGYRERWQSDESKPALARGTAWHEILEAHYLGQLEKVDTLLGRRTEQTEQQELLQWMYDRYVEMWAEADREWTIQAVEYKGFAPLPNPDGGPSRFILKVKIDLLAARRGRLWVWDHKSGANLPTDRDLDFDDQFGLYSWCMRQMGYPVMGAIYNAARTQRNKKTPQPLESCFSRTPLARTDYELTMIAAEAYRTAERAWPEVPVQLGRIPERTPNTETCKWKCDYKEACLSGRKGGSVEPMLRAHGMEPRPFREVEMEWKELNQ
jgi:hypothetical protein